MARRNRRSDDRRQLERRADEQVPTTSFQVTAAKFSGPLPPPTILEAYNQIIPNGAERIMAMAERNQSHRHDIENRVVNGNLRAQPRGQWFAFTISLVAIGGGIGLAAYGMDAIAITSILTGLGTPVGLFIYAQESKKRELRAKADDLVRPLPGP
jgi:uncharacterized membrane protein